MVYLHNNCVFKKIAMLRSLLIKFFFILICVNFSTACVAQNNNYSSPDSLIAAVYDVISGPKGDRDWNAFHALFHEDARMGSTVLGKDSLYRFVSFSPQEYQEKNTPVFQQTDFYEKELSRETVSHGGLLFVNSEYEFRFHPKGQVIQSGRNFIQLVKEKDRWWITSLVWEGK